LLGEPVFDLIVGGRREVCRIRRFVMEYGIDEGYTEQEKDK
jgi:hypothetical protein